MTIVAAAPIRVRMSRTFEAALMYANVSPPEITSTDPIKVSCQSIAIASPRILLASRASLTDSEHGKNQMPQYVILGLAARKALPGSRAAKRGIDSFIRGMDGYTFLSFTLRPSRSRDKNACWFCAGNPVAGFSCLMARAALGGSVSATSIAATNTSQVSGSVPRHATRARRCSPALKRRGPRGLPCLAHLAHHHSRLGPKLRPKC
jgi:hypothetical protein